MNLSVDYKDADKKKKNCSVLLCVGKRRRCAEISAMITLLRYADESSREMMYMSGCVAIQQAIAAIDDDLPCRRVQVET